MQPSLLKWLLIYLKALKAHTAACVAGLNSGDISLYKSASCKPRQTVKAAGRWWGDKVKIHFYNRGNRCMWQRLGTITKYIGGTLDLDVTDSSLVGVLNTFYAHIEVSN